jgi:Fe-S cluster biogenesis protein NfuA
VSDTIDLQEVGERLERILGELSALADPTAGERATEAVRLVTELYGAGLSTMLELVVDAGDAPLLDKMVSDPLVSSLLVLHDLHPFDLAARLGLALDKIRPYLASHGGDVEVLDVDAVAGSVTIRLLGSCDGCPSSSVTLKMAVEAAIHEGAPEVAHIVVDGWVEPEAPPVPSVPIELRPKPVSVGAAG